MHSSSSNEHEELYTAVHRKEYEMEQLKNRAKALRRVYEDPAQHPPADHDRDQLHGTTTTTTMGVHTVVVDSVANFAELVEEISHEMTHSGSFKIGDKIIFIAGRRTGTQVEQLQVVDLTAGKSYGHITKSIGGVFYFNRALLVKYSGEYESSVIIIIMQAVTRSVR
jgi:hypothetical protein